MSLFNIQNYCDGIFLDLVDIRLGKQCDNDCSFCIDKRSFTSLSDNVNIESIIHTYKKLGNVDEITISGGEPFLIIDKLLSLVIQIKEIHPLAKIFINTALPITFINSEDKIEKIMELIDCLNVSLNHYEEKQNLAILRATSKHSRLTIIKNLCIKHADKIRVSFNLVKGFIDTNKKIEEALDVFHSLGIKKVRIRELFHAEDVFVNYEEITNTKMSDPYALGCVAKIFDEKRNMHIDIKRTCFSCNKKRYASLRDIIKIIYMKLFINRFKKSFHVLYEDGSAYNNWW